MRMRIWVKGFVLVPALFLAGIPATAQSQDSSQQQSSDPVAEAARKARQAKKETPKPKKVYTDDDLKTGSSDAVSTVGTTSTTPQPTGTPTKGDGEAAWRAKFKDQRDRIDRAEKELDILQRELQKAQLEYYPDPQKAMTEQNTRGEINDKTAKIDAKQKEIAQLKQGLDDLEDQLRKAGGDPGWAR